MRSELRQTFKNMVTNWVAISAQGVIGFFLVPLFLSYFGRDGYGIIGLLGVLLGLTAIADIGLRNALGRELSEKHAEGSVREYNELMATAMLLYIGIAFVISTLLYVAAPWIVNWINIPPDFVDLTLKLLRVYGPISVILSFITPVFTAALSSHHRFDIVNNINAMSRILTSILMFIALKYIYPGLWSWVFLQIFSQALIAILQYIYYRKACKGYKFSFKEINISYLKPLFSLGKWIYLIQLSGIISQRSDPIVLSYFMGPSAVALYTPGSQISKLSSPLVLALTSQLFPLATQRHIKGETGGMKRLLALGTMYTILLGIPVSVFSFLYAMPFCELWLYNSIGSDYRIVAYILMGWSIVDFLTFCGGSQWPVLLGMKKIMFIAKLNVMYAILNIILSVVFVKYTAIGVPGVILATVLVEFIRRPVIIRYAARSCGMTVLEYFNQGYSKPLLVLMTLLVFVLPVNLLLQVHSFSQLILHALLVLLLWVIIGWNIGLNDEDKIRIRKLLSRKTPKNNYDK